MSFKHMVIYLLAIIILMLHSPEVSATEDPPVHHRVQCKEGSDFEPWQIIVTSGSHGNYSQDTTVARQTFGVKINDELREPCYTIAVNNSDVRENGTMCSKFANRIGPSTNCSLKDGCAGITLKTLTLKDSGTYFFETEYHPHSLKRHIFVLKVFAKAVVTTKTIATTPGTKPVTKSSKAVVTTDTITTTVGTKPVSSCLTPVPVGVGMLLFLSFFMVRAPS